MDCSKPGFPVHHQLPKFAQTHVHWVGDAIQPSLPLSPSSPPAFPSIRVFSNESSLWVQMLISSRNILTGTPQIMSKQVSGCPRAQSSWHIKVTIIRGDSQGQGHETLYGKTVKAPREKIFLSQSLFWLWAATRSSRRLSNGGYFFSIWSSKSLPSSLPPHTIRNAVQRSHLEHSPSILFPHLFSPSLKASFLFPSPAPHSLVYFVQDKLLFRSSAIKGISSHYLICTVAPAAVTCS